MVEFAAAALTAVTSAFSSATTAATTAASSLFSTGGPMLLQGAVPAASTGFSAGSIFTTLLQGGGSLVSAMAAVRHGDEQARTSEMQAADARFDANSAEINGLNKTAGMRRELARVLGERDAAYAASGTDLSFGTPAVARDQAIDDSNRAVEGQDSATELAAGRLRERATNYLMIADEQRRGGRARATGSVLSGAGAIARRG